MAHIIDGRKLAARIIAVLKREKTPNKILAAVLIGNNKASFSYIKQKEKAAKSLGISFKIFHWRSKSERILLKKFSLLNREKNIGGIVLQLPLPQGFNRDTFIALLDLKKDVDALKTSAYVLPPTVGVLQKILKAIKFDLRSKKTAVIGRGFLVGKPVAEWLRGKARFVRVLGRGEVNRNNLKNADLIITGVGKPGLIRGEYIKKGAVLIDFGYAFKNGKAVGDIDFESCRRKASYITPTPGGTGPMVVAQLFENFYKLTK